MPDFNQLNLSLHAMVIFRNLMENELIKKLSALLTIAEKSPVEQIDAYSSFASQLISEGGNLSDALFHLAAEDVNSYVLALAQNKSVDALEDCLKSECSTLEKISALTSAQVKMVINYKGYLPEWQTTAIGFYDMYKNKIRNINKNGFGIFANYSMFYVKDNNIKPVKLPDPIRLADLKGYERERHEVVKNTLALLKGKPAANVLLYGDAGTGKSSTVKAIVNEYWAEGLRLIEISKKQFSEIPSIIENLSQYPLKFILLLDDLSFEGDTDDFKLLKTILEGSASAKASNITIYVTSNRRHLIKETFSDRNGDDIHQNETLQEMISLSDRFGLSVYFYTPDKGRFLHIVQELAQSYGVKLSGDALSMAAEQYALVRGGRSPRVARHFVDHLLSQQD